MKDGYTYSSALGNCVLCDSSANETPFYVALVLLSFLIIGCGSIFFFGDKIWDFEVVKVGSKMTVIRLFSHFDMGMARVAWSTYQIISSISWNLNVSYPQPFKSVLLALGFLQLDFLALDCVRFICKERLFIVYISAHNHFFFLFSFLFFFFFKLKYTSSYHLTSYTLYYNYSQ
jgi:hypothetical protein